MTREEAIAVLQKIKPIPQRGDGKSTTHAFEIIAIDMAIKALEQEPCEDAISRQAVLSLLHFHRNDEDKIEGYVKTKDIINLPSVTPQPKTGHWIRMKAYEKWLCSECDTVFRFTFKEHGYCPNCGAKMREW